MDAISDEYTSFGRQESCWDVFIESGTLLGPEGSARQSWFPRTAYSYEPSGSPLEEFLVGVGVLCGTDRILRTSQWTRASL